MSLARVVDALTIPPSARVDQRVPKKLLIEHGAPTAADKRRIQSDVEEVLWVATLKPTTIAVPAFQDDVREYLEIAVITAVLRAPAPPKRIVELLHRAIPYPLVLVAAHGDTVSLSLAHKRRSQGEAGKIVIEEVYSTAPFQPDISTKAEAAFLAALAVSDLPTRDLFAHYQGWIDRVTALAAAQITGTFVPPESADRALALRESLATYTTLQRDISGLRAQARKEKQINRRVELNLKIKRLEAGLAETERNF